MSLAQAIDNHFPKHKEVKDFFEKKQTSTLFNSNTIIFLNIIISLLLTLGYILFKDGTVYVPLDNYILTFMGMYFLFTLSKQVIFNRLLEYIYSNLTQATEIQLIYPFFAQGKLLQKENYSDQDITYYLLYAMWETDNNAERIDYAKKLMQNIDEKNIQNHEIKEFMRRLESNKDFIPKIIEEDLPTIMRHIIEFEQKTTIYGKRDEFITEDLNEIGLQSVAEEVNQAHQYELDDSTLAMSRKLLEATIIELYRRAYILDPDNIYGNTHMKTLNALQTQLKEDREELEPYLPTDYDNLLNNIDSINKKCNKHVHHGGGIIRSEDELEEFKYKLNRTLQDLLELYERLNKTESSDEQVNVSSMDILD